MQRLILIGAIAAVAFACGTGADMIGEMLDAGVPDAGAQLGELRLECDIRIGGRPFAEASASELPGPFTVFGCDLMIDGETLPIGPCGGNVSDCPIPQTFNCAELWVSNPITAVYRANDGSYAFGCGQSSRHYSYLKIIR